MERGPDTMAEFSPSLAAGLSMTLTQGAIALPLGFPLGIKFRHRPILDSNSRQPYNPWTGVCPSNAKKNLSTKEAPPRQSARLQGPFPHFRRAGCTTSQKV